MIQCSSFLESVNRNRQQALGKEHVSTEQGALYPNTLVCLSESIKVIREVAVRLQEDGLDTEMLDLHAFMNESAVEHSFAAGVQQTQYRVLTHEQYAKHKVGSAESLILILILNTHKNMATTPVKSLTAIRHPLETATSPYDVIFGVVITG